jgi:uncharacterized membrane protein
MPALWLRVLTLVVSIVGLADSAYITVQEETGSPLAGCPVGGGMINCESVLHSPEAVIVGVPVAAFGIVFFVFMLAIMSPWAWRSSWREIWQLRLASLIVGMGFVIYLVYAELIEIGKICLYCTSVHILTFLLFSLTVIGAAIWGAPSGSIRTRDGGATSGESVLGSRGLPEVARGACGRACGAVHDQACGSEVVWQDAEGLVRCQRANRAEISSVQGQYRVRAEVGRHRDIDRVGQVEFQVGVLELHIASEPQRIRGDLGYLKTHTQGLGDDVADDRIPGPCAEPDFGQVIHFSQHERRDDHGASVTQQVQAGGGLGCPAIRGRNYP